MKTVRSNEQMAQSMKGATILLGSMNKQMNLPALQRIAMEFERENEIMDQRQEMMDDAVDEATGLDDEEEGEEIVKEVLDEIGVDLGQAVCLLYPYLVFHFFVSRLTADSLPPFSLLATARRDTKWNTGHGSQGGPSCPSSWRWREYG